MRRPPAWRRRIGPLPVRALYTLGELAAAAAMPRQRLHRLLERLDVQMLRCGKILLVPLTELEKKAWPFWESVRAAGAIQHDPPDD